MKINFPPQITEATMRTLCLTEVKCVPLMTDEGIIAQCRRWTVGSDRHDPVPHSKSGVTL